MTCLHHYLLFLLLLLAVSGDLAGVSGAQCQPDQGAALLRLKAGFAQPALPSWRAGTDCCAWEGVACDASDGRIIHLDLSLRFIAGNLSADLFSLTSLRFLNLAYNQFDGRPLPSRGFERLVSLAYLNLSNAGFVGQVPAGIGCLTNLVTLDLSTLVVDALPNNSLVLKDPTFQVLIANLSKLQKLYLDGVNMSASGAGWAAAVANAAPGLQELSLTGCSLVGPIDKSFPKLRLLSKLYLDHNHLSCPVPDFFADFSSLSVLSLSDCGLTGSFPQKILQIKNLTVLDLSYNPGLSGELPDFVQGNALQSLVLGYSNFSGVIPESVGNLQLLSRLQLQSCQFHGSLPSSISKLRQLVHLDLSLNNFSGEIPPSVQWTMISEVILGHNNFVGSLPSNGYMGLHSLKKIDMQSNSISGLIPASLFSLPTLQLLQLSQNNFSGNLPEFGNASSVLQTIDLSGNYLQGPIPQSLFKLSGLSVLILASNSFSGTVDLDLLQGLVNLSNLDLSNNRISVVEGNGSSSLSSYPSISTLKLVSCNLTKLPSFLMNQNGTSSLDLSNNNICGPIPNWIWSIGKDTFIYLNLSHNSFTFMDRTSPNLSSIPLKVLDLHSNRLGGSLPLPPRSIIVLDYSENYFTSSIPSNFSAYLSYVVFFSLSKNNLIGEIPDSICNASYLQVLDLSYNSLSGPIPSCFLEGSTALVILNLRGNLLNGSLPQNINEGCVLRTMNLGSNKLEGRLPKSLVNCSMLEVLDIGNNDIVDEFPYWLGNLSRLKVLVLRSNGFHGPIGHPGASDGSSSPFPMVQIFDLSSNHFNGYIPAQCFKNLKAMMFSSVLSSQTVGFSYLELAKDHSYYQDSVTVTLKGLEITYVKILSIFTSLDLANNGFQGIIPTEIGELKLLHVLNFSRNALTGVIPSQISNLAQLESLDLSSNQLSGDIPPALASLTFLSYLNLSDNKLDGRIPQSNQFSTFSNTSFLGNEGLCGGPLSRQCNATAPVPGILVSKSISMNWQFIFAGLGLGTGFAIVVVPLMVWRKGKRWYKKHVNKLLLSILPMWLCNSCKNKRVGTEEWESDSSGVLEEEEEEPGPNFCLFCTRLEFIGDRVRIHHVECSCNVVDCQS